METTFCSHASFYKCTSQETLFADIKQASHTIGKMMTGVEMPNSKDINSSESLTGTGKETLVKLLKRP